MTEEEVDKLTAALPKFVDWTNANTRRVRLKKDETSTALEDFVKKGGVIIALGNQPTILSRLLKLLIRTGTYIKDADSGKERRTKRSEFFIPASLLRMKLNTDDPLAYGSSAELAAMFRRGTPFEIQDQDRVRTLATFANKDLLMSGWAIGANLLLGQPAIVSTRMGKGKIYLFGIDTVYRGQPLGTVKLLFNSILHGAGD